MSEGGEVVSSLPIKEKARRLYRAAKGAFRKRVPRKVPSLALLFDAGWYAKGLGKKAVLENPLDHYLKVGFMTGDPNPMFDTAWYVARHPELRSGRKNPFVHYFEIGERAGDPPSPRFDPKWYLEKYPDVAATRASPLAHFLRFGAAEGRLPKRPAHFDSWAALSGYLAELPPTLAAVPCSIELPVRAMGSLETLQEGGNARDIFRVAGGFCEGLNGAPDYPPSAYVARIEKSMLLAGTRYLVAPSGFLLHDENAHFLAQPDVAVKYKKATRSATSGQLNLEAMLRQGAWVESGLNVMHEYENNYFHFIAETLPRMILAEEAGVPPTVPFLVTGDLHPNIEKLFDISNTARRPVIALEKGTLYRVEEMYYPSDLTSVIDAYEGGRAARQTGLDVGRIRMAIDRCKQRFPVGAIAGKRRIFASRNGSYRNLLNQKQIENRLLKIGFEIVCADELDLEEQIRIFQDAEMVVGSTGAQMSNMVWCRPGTRVLVLASDHPSHQLYFWELLGRVSGAAVTILQGPRANARDDIYSLHDDYYVDEGAVVAAISRIK
ncbi:MULTISPECIES: glycosyltransferase family 61 protein [Variovorax]|uniref:glycosyltransferase family 61 protein n=1 Tax=Variovorax TaxID=34072 RepID=UPI000AB84877|nr:MULTISPECIES: glycosyltransferase family 61 protein [Variovorax]MBN8757440.1 glycosyltransferase family 61 protein [Variovorax sp.]UKI09476.1 glycosyltransferase family 61 protein [Variovorax paradoxus]